MSKQRTLDLFRRPAACSDTAGDPVFWIEEVRLLKTFSPDPAEQIREPITFQKGLNIVWAPAPSMKQRKDINFAGHAAGKTTLCRLLRYLLGEQHVAAPGVKEAIEENFYNGWIVGKIHVVGQPWIVARPLHHATRPRARCLPSDSFEELLSKPETSLTFDDFQKALAAATCSPLPVALFGDGTTGITFAHVLQWLARDQDCHLTRLNFFRHPDSKSDSPNLSAESAYFLQRVMLNLADADLRKAITNCEKLEKEERDLPADKEYLLRREKELNLYLEGVSIKHPRAPLFTEIEITVARKATDELEQKDTKITRDAIRMAKDSRTGMKSQLASLQEQLGAVKANAGMARAAVKDAQTELHALEGKVFNLEVEKEKAKKMPPSAYCRVPREIAETCRHFREWDVLSENEEQAESMIARQKKDAAKRLGQCQTNLKNLEDSQKRIEKEIKSFTGNAGKLASKIETLEQKLKDLKQPYTSIRTKITDLEEVIQKLARLSKRETTLKGEVEKAKGLQEKLQRRHKETEDLFVDEYAWTVAQIFGGEETVTQCKFTREKITTKVTYDGKDLTSAAVTALETFCFDLAAMAFSCRGRGFHPRFLLHDSPREADMGEAPYGRIFDLIVQQSKEQANFQHIVTTTSNPPEEYLKLPYLRLKLDSSKADGKLFGQNL